MSRDEMVERVARAVQQHGVGIGADSRTWDEIPEFAREQYRDDARVAVDVILPLSRIREVQPEREAPACGRCWHSMGLHDPDDGGCWEPECGCTRRAA